MIEHLRRALDRQDTHTLDSALEEIAAGRAQAWHGKSSVIVTKIVDYPLQRVCRIWLAAGNMNELTSEMLPAVEAWAVENECSRVEIIGRRGWARVLADYWQPPYITLCKDLRHE